MSDDTDQPSSRSRRRLLTGLALAGSAVSSAANSRAAPALTRDQLKLKAAITGDVYWRGQSGYEEARASAVWRANKPERYPTVIVQVQNAADVQAAVRYARTHGLKVGRRAGGHSWSSAFMRDGAMLIDLSRLQDIAIDVPNRSVWTGAGVLGSILNGQLMARGLIVPTAHHLTPGISGFVMCGGFGWNSRLWGNGCAHIQAIDVVTATGELIRADDTQHSDYLWAARGSGAGFPGVVTRFQLMAHALPSVVKVSAYTYSADELEAVFTWARSIASQVPPYLELVIVCSAHDEQGNWTAPRLTVAGLALTDSDDVADEALALLATCPVIDKALRKRERVASTIDERYVSGYSADPAGHRFAADNLWTNASAEELVPKLRQLFTDLPSPRSHVFWFNWGPTKSLPDMAMSVQGEIYLAAYSIWDDPAEDERMTRWPVEQMRRLESLSVGGQMNDENMLARPQQRYLSEAASARLEQIRAQHDPGGVFLSYLR
ncbi:MAG: FAD-binding oxidoreductase [Steroidobacteraceae bacterium]|jgi:FAD/FMN-containing dehydrogenase